MARSLVNRRTWCRAPLSRDRAATRSCHRVPSFGVMSFSPNGPSGVAPMDCHWLHPARQAGSERLRQPWAGAAAHVSTEARIALGVYGRGVYLTGSLRGRMPRHRRLRQRFTQSERSILGGLSRLGIAGGGFQYLIRRAEEDADTKDYERADHRPPGERDFWNRGGLLERPGNPEQGCHRVQDENVQLADDHSHEEPG